MDEVLMGKPRDLTASWCSPGYLSGWDGEDKQGLYDGGQIYFVIESLRIRVMVVLTST
jgi:hypothetical protein